MRIITDIEKIHIETQSAVAIGKFDGVHKGHQELLRRIVARKEKGMVSVVFTFDPTPSVFFGYTDQKELTSKEEKINLFAEMGIDILICFPLNQQTAAIPAESFISDILCERLKMNYICAGSDLSFGDKGKGNSDLLFSMSKQFGYEAEIIEKCMHLNREISSTYIKEEVEKGNLAVAAQLMGRNYQVEGMVVYGNQIGRTLGMPTVNLIPGADKVLPPCGVYYARVKTKDGEYNGLTNIGYKPTVSEQPVLGIETYLYDFTGNLYGEKINVELIGFKRSEQKFAGLEMLKAQLEKDIAEGTAYFRKN